METRFVEQVKIYAMRLNPMRANTEANEVVAISYDKQALINYYNSQLAPEGYVEEGSPSFDCHGDTHRWHKSFIKGNLEWFNPLYDINSTDHYGHGIDNGIWVDKEDAGSIAGRFLMV